MVFHPKKVLIFTAKILSFRIKHTLASFIVTTGTLIVNKIYGKGMVRLYFHYVGVKGAVERDAKGDMRGGGGVEGGCTYD